MAGSGTIQGVKRRSKPSTYIGPRMQRILAQIADTDFPLLLAGEKGVGKRTVALQVHNQSHGNRGVFTEIRGADCTEQSILSVLSSRGTVYLADVGDLSPEVQVLVVDRYFQAAQDHARLVCGTSRELWEEVASCRMREDFFQLISAITIRIAPLRCRKTEIPLIADELLTEYSKQFDRPKPVLHDEILEFLTEHNWPGNLTEFQTAIKTFVAIGDQSISLAAIKAAASGARLTGQRPLSLKETTRTALIQIERQVISKVLVSTGGNRKRAANELGISYKALLYKLKQIGTEFQPASNGNGVA